MIPVFIFYAGYFFHHAPGYKPTGFIQYDNICYVAYAKQYTDQPGTGIGYSNPLNDSGNYGKIYFQTQTFLLAGLLKMGIDPGLALCLFSIFFCLLAIRTAISIYLELYPDARHSNKTVLLLIWGGGIISLSCLLLRPFMTTSLNFWSSIYYLDPEDGWWGLNLGRSLLFGTESYYHFLFLSSILFLLRKKWLAAMLVAFVLSFSHPFTGIHLLLVISAWITMERIIFRNKDIPWWLFGAAGLLMAVHLYYYLVYLPSFPDHKSVSEQYSVNWNYRNYRALPAFIPAYILVFILFMISLRIERVRIFFSRSNNRLLICLAGVTIVLCNHDLFMKPMQPIHFVRGYEWMAYFLMGVPALHYLMNRLKKLKAGQWALILGMLLLLSDNLLWITNYVKTARDNETTLSDRQQLLLKLIQPVVDNTTLIIGSDPFLMPYCLVYTNGYAWISHPYTTPFYKQKLEAYKEFMSKGVIDPTWRSRKLLLIFNKADSMELRRSKEIVLQGKTLLDDDQQKVMMGTFELK